MSEKINEQAEKMREMAQTTLDKAKEAVSKYDRISKIEREGRFQRSLNLFGGEGDERKGGRVR